MEFLANPAVEQDSPEEGSVVQPDVVPAGGARLVGERGGQLAQELVRHEEDLGVGEESAGRGGDDVEGALQLLPGVDAKDLDLPGGDSIMGSPSWSPHNQGAIR